MSKTGYKLGALISLFFILKPAYLSLCDALYYNTKSHFDGMTQRQVIEYEIKTQAKRNGIDTNVALKIARCESNLNPYAKNPNSSATGLFQFTSGTWNLIGGQDIFDYKEQIKMFVEYYPQYPYWWECK